MDAMNVIRNWEEKEVEAGDDSSDWLAKRQCAFTVPVLCCPVSSRRPVSTLLSRVIQPRPPD